MEATISFKSMIVLVLLIGLSFYTMTGESRTMVTNEVGTQKSLLSEMEINQTCTVDSECTQLDCHRCPASCINGNCACGCPP
ncbi:hypothetical protein RND81_14G242800 [Saponaria officinalis]|uniref:Uncharacterized protein n=1 Tax=Saponaria officinalis TaxID=3572 RepID=A0AAW1GR56_SAPOF